MGVGVLAVKESRFCTLVLDKSLSLFVVVSKSFSARFEHLAKVNACNVVRIDNAIGSAHEGTLELNEAPFVKVPLLPPLP